MSKMLRTYSYTDDVTFISACECLSEL